LKSPNETEARLLSNDDPSFWAIDHPVTESSFVETMLSELFVSVRN
jgi:hypothetical protein